MSPIIATTFCPEASPLPSGAASTVPAASIPGTRGKLTPSLRPSRSFSSERLSPNASTRIRTQPSRSGGSGSVVNRRLSTGPGADSWTARIVGEDISPHAAAASFATPPLAEVRLRDGVGVLVEVVASDPAVPDRHMQGERGVDVAAGLLDLGDPAAGEHHVVTLGDDLTEIELLGLHMGPEQLEERPHPVRRVDLRYPRNARRVRDQERHRVGEQRRCVRGLPLGEQRKQALNGLGRRLCCHVCRDYSRTEARQRESFPKPAPWARIDTGVEQRDDHRGREYEEWLIRKATPAGEGSRSCWRSAVAGPSPRRRSSSNIARRSSTCCARRLSSSTGSCANTCSRRSRSSSEPTRGSRRTSWKPSPAGERPSPTSRPRRCCTSRWCRTSSPRSAPRRI